MAFGRIVESSDNIVFRNVVTALFEPFCGSKSHHVTCRKQGVKILARNKTFFFVEFAGAQLAFLPVNVFRNEAVVWFYACFFKCVKVTPEAVFC